MTSYPYYVVILHKKGAMPQFLEDHAGEPITFDSSDEAYRGISKFWQDRRNLDTLLTVKLTVVKLED